jgi:NTE family protein
LKDIIGLALSGGGVKGAVHAGMIHFFDEIGFKPDIISASSAGALVGAFYSSGKSGKEIFDFFLNERPFSRSLWSGNMGLINTPELKKTIQKHMPIDSFEELNIPIVTTTTNMFSGSLETFRSGDLIEKILASSSFPGVFSPMQINGQYYSDGGILNNFPADIIREECDFLIGMNLSPNKLLTADDLKYTKDILSRTVDIQGSQAELNKLKLCDIGMCPDELTTYSTFDFNPEKMQELFDLGYSYIKKHQATIEMLNAKPKQND